MRLEPLGWPTAVLAFASSVLGNSIQFSPGGRASGLSFRVNVPTSTASSRSGPIYFQISAPNDVQWVGLGQGAGMDGANVFMLYSASSTNVTLSPRLAAGYFEPEVNPDAKISLLEGTGISDGRMVANVRCDTCMSWEGGMMDPTDTASPWIWGLKMGSSIDSSDTDEDLQQHDVMGTFTLDLTRAVGGSSDNPFQDIPSNDPPPPTSTNSNGAVPVQGGRSAIEIKRIAHGLIMSIVVVVLFPLFALSLQVIPSRATVPYIHAPLQLVALCLAIAGFGIGISLALDLGVISGYHPVIGLIMIGSLILFQPALGLLQHMHFRKTGERSSFGDLHRWGGRLLIVLGIVNGGLGFKFSGIGNPTVPRAGVIAYGVIAGVMGLVYVAIVLVKSLKQGGNAQMKPIGSNGNTPPKGSAEQSITHDT
ncbi:cellobiose dehydrogenase [Coccidioides immitis RS]|uniref:Cellobiose dehydrogenase n=5 Tax=Coccidioides immitis TaxID=5501 RepID=A0A0E1RX44_COCIM|nr:cellobiose dehydrogenase [Coccidioides immitis RS]EAS33327.1 cellobiose dehydrogenase [Coccidioides immitis RS]KMP04481.1 integral membrane protein [Coccidioides immitis RMSCC 2394]KMU76060.1 integral membrane protein [Coccidioides immitis RMSCC 3703]TPX21084.1 hypothetical protein DIZ76_015037 [Coccidioides immitis]